MAADDLFRVTHVGIQQYVDRLGALPAQIAAASWRTFTIKGQQAEQRMKLLAQRNFRWRTGSLAGALGFLVEMDGEWPTLELGAVHEPPPHLAVQEYGMTILGKPWLTVPIEHPRNPMLSQSGGAETGGAGGIFARDIKADPAQYGLRGTFVHEGIIFGVPATERTGGTGARGVATPSSVQARGLQSPPGNEAARRREKERVRRRAFELAEQHDLIPIAVLKRSVTIPARPFMGPVWEQMEREIPRELEAQVIRQIQSEREAAGS